jgi:hypothetical protein
MRCPHKRFLKHNVSLTQTARRWPTRITVWYVARVQPGGFVQQPEALPKIGCGFKATTKSSNCARYPTQESKTFFLPEFAGITPTCG